MKDYRIMIRYNLPNGRASFRSCWRSQLDAAVARNLERGITNTEWRASYGPARVHGWRKA